MLYICVTFYWTVPPILRGTEGWDGQWDLYRAALGYWWDSIGQSHLSSMNMVQWNRTVDTWDMYMCMCKSSWYVVVQWSPVWEVYVPWYTRDPQVEYGILMADLDIPQAPIGLGSSRLRQQL